MSNSQNSFSESGNSPPNSPHPRCFLGRRLSLPEQTIIRAYQQGNSIETIARRFGVSYGGIRGLSVRNGATFRSNLISKTAAQTIVHRYTNEGKSITEIATVLGIHWASVKDRLSKAGIAKRSRPNKVEHRADGTTVLFTLGASVAFIGFTGTKNE